MKKIIVGILALSSFQAFAHPGDNEPLVNIGVGTKLKILKDINIAPNSSRSALGDRCYLELKKTKDFDRVLATGSTLIITGSASAAAKYGFYYDAEILYVDNKNVEFVACQPRPTIGDLKDSAKDLLNVILADPTKI